MKTITTTVVLLLVQSLNAQQDSSTVLRVLEKLNKRETNSCKEAETPLDPMQACAVDLCGPPDPSLLTLSINDDSFEPQLDSKTRKEISDTVQSMLQLEKKVNQADMERCSKKAKKNLDQIDSLSDEEFSNIIGFFVKEYTSFYFTPDHPDQFKKAVESFSGEPMADSTMVMDIVMGEGGDSASSENNNFDLEGNILIEANFPENLQGSLREIILSYAETKRKSVKNIFLEDLRFFSNKDFKYKEDSKSVLIPESLIQMHFLKDTDTEDYRRFRPWTPLGLVEDLVNFIRDTRRSSEALLANKNICPTPQACRAAARRGLQAVIQNYTEKMKERQSADNQEAQALCQSVLDMAFVLYNKSLNFTKKLPDIKKTFLEQVFANYSHQSKQTFDNILNALLRDVVEDKHPIEDFKGVFKAQIDFVSNYVDQVVSSYEDQEPSSLLDSIYDLVNENSNCQPKVLESLCESKSSVSLSRFNAFSADSLQIATSPFSCMHQDFGEQIYAHELAHLLSHTFRQQYLSQESYIKYQQLRLCVTRHYKNEKGEDFIEESDISMKEMRRVHAGDSLHTEEDMADLISYKVFSDHPTLYSCALLDHEEKQGQTYDFLSESPIMGDGLSPHSNTLIRVIREALYKKREIPPSCKFIMNQHKDQLDFELCF